MTPAAVAVRITFLALRSPTPRYKFFTISALLSPPFVGTYYTQRSLFAAYSDMILVLTVKLDLAVMERVL